MPLALLIALVASFGIHGALLFGPEIDLSPEPETLPILAELRPVPKPAPVPAAQIEPARKPAESAVKKNKPAVKKKLPRKAVEPVLSTTPVLSVPDQSPLTAPVATGEGISEPPPELPTEALAETPEIPVEAPVPPPAPRLPERGMIAYRVDRGDSNFEIGKAVHAWDIADGHYRLSSVVETTGLVWLFKSVRIEMESSGRITAEGLRPDTFAIRRNGQPTRETAAFDWDKMTVSVGERGEQPLDHGAQDLLSFNYQLGFMTFAETGSRLPIATGKKYGIYPLERLGDEEITVPAGVLRTLHLRAPGVNTTELWLAYDYLLLPVKIRHVDNKGDSLVQVATEIQLSPP